MSGNPWVIPGHKPGTHYRAGTRFCVPGSLWHDSLIRVKLKPIFTYSEIFYQIASTTPENVQITRMRVVPGILLDLKRQCVHAAPHVGHTGRQPDTNTARNRDHRRARTESTRASAEPSTARSTITREPSDSAISIRPVPGASPAATSATGSGVRASHGSTSTGTNRPHPSARSRNRRRQVNTRLAFTSLRRATTRDRNPGLVALRQDPALLGLTPATPQPPTSPPLPTSAIVSI